jgi:glutamate/tyrosine decarboxylase-like PLP-dependent enzyme
VQNAKPDDRGSSVSGLPAKGVPWSDIEVQLRELKSLDVDGLRGRLPAYIYYYNEELLDVQKRAFCAYILENGLGTETAFKSLGFMQSAIFEMAFRLFNAPESAGAVFTSGGTISILDAVRMARNKARADRGERYGIYNIVAPFSAHPALNKAADFLDLEIKRVPLGRNYRGDLQATVDAIDDKTIMLFGSAPCYPFGVFDSIEEYSELAMDRGLWLHVDACMGGFLSPFAKKLGYHIPSWDFALPGVTSISADIHKYGYGVKGASLLLLRDRELQKKYGEFVFHDWHRGTYASPSIAGSSPGGAISAAYAVMQFLGEEGYLRITKATMDAVHKWISGVNSIDGLRCFEPNGESALFGFYSTDPNLDILAVAERRKEKGWYPGLNTSPFAIQQGVTAVHIPIIDEYLAELRDAVTVVRKTNAKGTFNARTY